MSSFSREYRTSTTAETSSNSLRCRNEWWKNTIAGSQSRVAALPADKKEMLIKVNDELSKLFIQYNKNLLNATNSFFVTVYDKADLAGLPQSSISRAAEEAKARGLDGLWVFTLHAPSRLPVLQSAENRGLREAIYKGYTPTLLPTGNTTTIP